MIKTLLSKPSVYVGLLLRLAALFYFPVAGQVENFYVPFLTTFLESPSLDPWGTWLNQGGDPQAFPYGVAMLLAFSPFLLAVKASGGAVSVVLVYQICLLLFDIGLFIIAVLLSSKDINKAINFYWLSPIAIVSIQVLGLNDVIPVFFLMLSVLMLRKNYFAFSGISLAIAISIKLSMALAGPVFAILFLRNRSLKTHAPRFLAGLGSGLTLLVAPLGLLSPDWIKTIGMNSEAAKILQPSLEQLGSNSLLIVPMAYLFALYLIWRVRRLNFDLFEASLGITFLAVVLTVQSSPGWYLWVLPLLLSINSESKRKTGLLVWGFSATFLLSNAELIFEATNTKVIFPSSLSEIFHTILFVSGVLLATRVWRDGVTLNDYFLLSRKPFAIGIAGDSGVGKDTFANSIAGVFGFNSTTHLSGDDYHLWDRGRPMWKALTHLNPAANNLTQLERDAISLMAGRTVQVRHYNHETGIYDKGALLKSNDFLIFSGLHTLKLPTLPTMLDLSIYLEMDEGLRRALKIERDVTARGHSLEKVESSLARREPDVQKFIAPQKHTADLVFRIDALPPAGGTSSVHAEFVITVTSKLGMDFQEMKRVLVSLAQVDFTDSNSDVDDRPSVTISGNLDSQEVEAAVNVLAPRVLEFCASKPIWMEGALGIMQLAFFVQLEHVLVKRTFR